MNEPEQFNRKLEMRLTILVFVLLSMNALGTCILTGFTNASWDEMGTDRRVLLGVAIFTNWSGMMIAFVNRNFARLMAGKPPTTNGGSGFDTGQITKSQIDPGTKTP